MYIGSNLEPHYKYMDNIEKVNRNKSRAPRPIKGKITVVVLESYNEHTSNWELCGILFDTTPLNAVKQYYKEFREESITKNDVADYGNKIIAEYAQAFYLSI